MGLGKLDIELLPALEEIADICIGNIPPEDVSSGEFSTLPEILSLVQFNQDSKEYLGHGLRKVRVLEQKVRYLCSQLEMLKTKQEMKL